MRPGTLATLLLACASLAGCKAELGDPDPSFTVDSGTGSNADAGTDAAIDAPIDAAMVVPDARQCAGGAAHAMAADGTCYLRFDTPQDHTSAKALCAANAATLAIIKTAAEQATAITLGTTADIYIGADDLTTENAFIWPDATPVVFDAWNTGEPNNGGTNGEDCSVLAFSNARAGTWDDRDCALPYLVLCSFKP